MSWKHFKMEATLMAIKYNCKIKLMQDLGHVMMSMYGFYYQKRLFCILRKRKMILVSYFLIYWLKIQEVHVLQFLVVYSVMLGDCVKTADFVVAEERRVAFLSNGIIIPVPAQQLNVGACFYIRMTVNSGVHLKKKK